MPNTKRKYPAALPVFSTDTVEEAESLRTTFGMLVSAGPLAGRYVCSRVGFADTTEEAMAAMKATTAKMGEVYARMKARAAARPV